MAKGQKKGWLHCPPEQKQKKKKKREEEDAVSFSC